MFSSALWKTGRFLILVSSEGRHFLAPVILGLDTSSGLRLVFDFLSPGGFQWIWPFSTLNSELIFMARRGRRTNG